MYRVQVLPTSGDGGLTVRGGKNPVYVFVSPTHLHPCIRTPYEFPGREQVPTRGTRRLYTYVSTPSDIHI